MIQQTLAHLNFFTATLNSMHNSLMYDDIRHNEYAEFVYNLCDEKLVELRKKGFYSFNKRGELVINGYNGI